jgi:hypothetical protein
MQQQRKGIKLLHDNFTHHGFTYRPGLNVDPLPFTAYGNCEPGGLYYTVPEYACKWVNPVITHVADVTVPDDQPVWADDHCPTTKWKAPQLFLSNIRPLHEFLLELSDQLLFQFTQLAHLHRMFFSQHTTRLYHRCLHLNFDYVFNPLYMALNELKVIVKIRPAKLGALLRRLTDDELLQLVEIKPECLMYYNHLTLVDERVFLRAVALDPSLANFALTVRPTLELK